MISADTRVIKTMMSSTMLNAITVQTTKKKITSLSISLRVMASIRQNVKSVVTQKKRAVIMIQTANA